MLETGGNINKLHYLLLLRRDIRTYTKQQFMPSSKNPHIAHFIQGYVVEIRDGTVSTPEFRHNPLVSHRVVPEQEASLKCAWRRRRQTRRITAAARAKNPEKSNKSVRHSPTLRWEMSKGRCLVWSSIHICAQHINIASQARNLSDIKDVDHHQLAVNILIYIQ